MARTVAMDPIAAFNAATAQHVKNSMFAYTENDAFPLDQVTDGFQNRAGEAGKVDKKFVARYTEMAKVSAPPRIVVTKDGAVISGNHRITAAKAAPGIHSIPAYVLDVEITSVGPVEFDRLKVLGGWLNAANGLPTDRATNLEAAKAQIRLTPNDKSNEHICATYGLTRNVVNDLRSEVGSETRLAEMGMGSLIEKLPTAVLRALGKPNWVTLNAEPFRQAVEMIEHFDLTAGDVRTLGVDLKVAATDGGDRKVLDVLADRRAMYIEAQAGAGPLQPTYSPGAKNVNLALSNIVKYAGQEFAAVETNPAKRDAYVAKLDQAIAVLAAIRAQYDNIDSEV